MGSQTLSSFLSLKVKYFARNEDQLALKVILQLGMRAEPQCSPWINKSKKCNTIKTEIPKLYKPYFCSFEFQGFSKITHPSGVTDGLSDKRLCHCIPLCVSIFSCIAGPLGVVTFLALSDVVQLWLSFTALSHSTHIKAREVNIYFLLENWRS